MTSTGRTLEDSMTPHLAQVTDQICMSDHPSYMSQICIPTSRCATCQLTYFTCPGHFGHIELPAPVFHPLFMVNMYNLLRGTCLFCHHFKMSRIMVRCSVGKVLNDNLNNTICSYPNTLPSFDSWNAVSLMRRTAWMTFTSELATRDKKRRKKSKSQPRTNHRSFPMKRLMNSS